MWDVEPEKLLFGSKTLPHLAAVSDCPLNIQRRMVAPVHRIGDGGHPGGVPNHPHKGCCSLQILHYVRPAALTQGCGFSSVALPSSSR